MTELKGILLPTSASHRYPSNPYRNWAPRVGLAWTFLPGTVFRAGYGWFYAPGSGGIGSSPGDLGSGSSVATGIYFGQALAAPNTPLPGSSLANPFVTGLLPYPNSLVGNGIGAIFPSWQTPMNQMWNANIQRSIGKDLLLEAAYIGSRGEHIWNNFTSNATFPQYLSLGTQLNNLVANPFYGKITNGAMSAAQVRLGSLLVPYPQYSGVTQIRASVGDSVYHGFTLRPERPFSHGLMFQASFTGAKLIDDVNERFLGGTNYIDPYNLKLSRAISAADVSQRFVANYVYELPFGHGKQFLSHGIAGWILGNWQNSGILSLQTGNPISIGASCNFAGASGLGCYADRLKDGNLTSGQSMNQWFDTTAFANPAPYSFGSGSRTEPDLRNPGAISFDSVLSRWQPIRERIAPAIPRGDVQPSESPEPRGAQHWHYLFHIRADHLEERESDCYDGLAAGILKFRPGDYEQACIEQSRRADRRGLSRRRACGRRRRPVYARQQSPDRLSGLVYLPGGRLRALDPLVARHADARDSHD